MNRTVIVGGGLMGLVTAQALLERGEPVIVIEARDDVALETSYGNAGIQTPSQGDPWNSPGVHWHLVSSLFNPRSPMKLRLREIPSLTAWGLRFLRNSARGPYLTATEANFHLGRYSVDQTRRVAAQLGIEYDASERGTMKVFRRRAAMQAPQELARHLSALGLRVGELDTAGAVRHEPLLADIREQVAGALYFPDDASGDSLRFCRGLRTRLARAGVEVLTSVRAQRLLVAGGAIQGALTDRGEIQARRVVIACGVWSAGLVSTAGVPLPVKPAKGYSLTIDLAEVPERPSIPVLDDAMHVAVTPLGNRLRIGGTAEFAGFNQRLNDVRVENLARVLKAIYPRLADRVDLGKAEAWTGLRPMSCDGRPFIGPCGPRGLYVNAGHGHLGWTQAAGSGQLLGDLMTGREPAIDAAPFRVQR